MNTTRDDEFRAYVLDRRPTLVRTATLLTAGDTHLAEDLVQTTLSRLYVAWPRFRTLANPEAYARRMLTNALIDEARRPWRRERSRADVPDRAMPTDAPSPRAEALNQALHELPPRMRAALVYRYFHDLSVAETADALGCSQGTVKSQTARGIDRLRAALGADLAGPDPGQTSTTHDHTRPGREASRAITTSQEYRHA